MYELCKTCKSRSYCYMINFRFFQSLGMLMNFDECPLYVCENGKIQSEDQQVSGGEHCDTPDASVREKEFQVTVELSIHGKVTEFELNGIKPENCSMLKRLSILVDKEALQRELGNVIDKEIRHQLGRKGKDSLTRRHADTQIKVPLIFSKWILD